MASFDLVSLVRHALVEGGLLLAPALLAGLSVALVEVFCSQLLGSTSPLSAWFPELWSLLLSCS